MFPLLASTYLVPLILFVVILALTLMRHQWSRTLLVLPCAAVYSVVVPRRVRRARDQTRDR